MTVFRTIGTTAATLAVVLTLAPIALGGGEPKNQWPFNRLAGERTAQGITTTAQANPAIQGEPKNEPPFTRPVGQRTTQGNTTTAQANPAIQGEPKNEPPFTRPATVVVVSSSGFDWTDGGIGVAAGIGIALAGAGAMALTRKSPRTA